ncbi:hypothetical protein FRB91_002463 [Serendipita sp. 411]|nr:hypothetical protein FRB91_002463 [Serendipita sp. 411]
MTTAEDRAMLITMGFTPDRVDWAIRETPPNADMQARLDYLFEHEHEPIPVQNTLSTASTASTVAPVVAAPLYSPPSHPPPTSARISSPSPPVPVVPIGHSPANLAESMGGMNLTESARAPDVVAETVNPVETEAIRRYQSFLSEYRDALRNVSNDQEAAKTFYTALTSFLEEEATKWRTELNIPVGATPTPPIVVKRDTLAVLAPESSTTPLVAVETPATAETVESASTDEVKAPESKGTYDCIRVYDPSRPRIPILASVVDFLANVITDYGEDDFVENARKRAWDIRPRMSEEVSNLRWKATVESNPSVDDDSFERRLEAHHERLAHLRPMDDWELHERVQREYEDQERLIRHRMHREKHYEYCKSFLDPAREMVHSAFTEIHPIYTEIQGYLEADNPELDVVRAVRALEQVSDTMELGMKELENLDDDRMEREWIFQRELITDDQTRTDPFGDANKMEKEKDLRMYEIKAMRAAQKVDRRAQFYALVIRRLREAISNVDKDYETLKDILKQLLETIPETTPFEQEEAQARNGDNSAMKIPLPSKELDEQIRSAQSSMYSVNQMRDDMRDVLRSFERKQMAERRENDMAQLSLNESRQGRADSWYFNAGRLLSERTEKEDEEIEKSYRHDQEQRREAFNGVISPVSKIITRYKDREMLVLQKLAGGMTAHGPMASSSSSDSTGGDSGDALVAMQKMMQQQQQTQMISNMMWSQHASRMSVINNIGSSNSQWVVKYN